MTAVLRVLARLLHRQARSLSGLGVVLGTLFFAAALTPTLVPRTYLTQGILAGVCFAAGYGLGLFWRWLWAYMELPEPPERIRRVTNAVIALLCLALALLCLWHAAQWQNSIRLPMGLAPVESAHPFKLSATALVAFALLLTLGRLFGLVVRVVARRSGRLLPRKVANVVGVAVGILLFWSLVNDVFFRALINLLDSSYREYDALLEAEQSKPLDPAKTGSAASLIAWNQLGRAGREFIASGPSAAQIEALSERPALEPIRVYAGLRVADTPTERARLAVEELKRVAAFDRAVLVIVTATGTGWIDPAAMDSLEYLQHGNIASVAMQYSYLSSPLALLVQPEYGAEAARALFSEVYAYWTSLPRGQRPRLYLHGLSLGAMNSERSAELFEMIHDPIQGALWSGPPFASRIWRSLSDGRNHDSPAWLPRFRDGSFVRFFNQDGASVAADAPWGPLRLGYLQYASDPVTFFDPRDFYRRPAWMEPPLGPDVSGALRWYPVVSMLQLALDMAMANSTPIGHGHVYAPEHYVDAWIAVTDVGDWSPEAIARLKHHLAQVFSQSRIDDGSKEDAFDNRGG